MKSIFNAATAGELIQRIHSLEDDSTAQWGKMTVRQMVQHCIWWDTMVLQNKKYKRPLIGLLIGPMIMKQVLKEGSIMRRNSPTIPALIVQETSGDLSILKGEWKALLNSYAEYTLPDFSFVHPFFGKMTREQVGFFAYKHADHHLKQFNC